MTVYVGVAFGLMLGAYVFGERRWAAGILLALVAFGLVGALASGSWGWALLHAVGVASYAWVLRQPSVTP